MVNRVSVVGLFCVYLCAIHQVYSDVLTNPKTEAGVLTLLQLRKEFIMIDYDDDKFLTFENLLRAILTDDLDNDGQLTYNEAKTNPDTSKLSLGIFNSWDGNKDNVLDQEDVRMFFEFLPGTGNKVCLHGFLVIYSTRFGKTEGPVMKIQSFVQAEKDFMIADEDDDNIVTKYEFQLHFRVADTNKNGNLEESEVRNMFPMRSTPPEKICPNITVSCSVDDVLLLFDAADTDNNSELNVEEYIKYFGTLIVNY